jgi:hypothetical protein
MPVTLEKVVSWAADDARRRGFHSVGIYHLLWACRELDAEEFYRWIALYQVEPPAFVKMLEAVLRPRRAGGGLPRDREDAELLNQLLVQARKLAAAARVPGTSTHLGPAFAVLKQDPFVLLCERFSLPYRRPEAAQAP